MLGFIALATRFEKMRLRSSQSSPIRSLPSFCHVRCALRAAATLPFKVLDPEDPGQRIMKAELRRELGSFDEAERLLDFPFEEEFASTARFIEKLALERHRRVAEVVLDQVN